jgi:hypothetical protein
MMTMESAQFSQGGSSSAAASCARAMPDMGRSARAAEPISLVIVILGISRLVLLVVPSRRTAGSQAASSARQILGIQPISISWQGSGGSGQGVAALDDEVALPATVSRVRNMSPM